MSRKPKEQRCDFCNKRIRRNQHELVLSDALTSQVIGRYHARPECQQSAVRYMLEPSVVLMASFVHPDRCGPEQERCDAGGSPPERAA